VIPRRLLVRGVLASCALLAGCLFARGARAEDEDVEAARARLVAAAQKGDRAVSVALDEAQKLVGPGRVWPDLGAYADWVETLPPDVNALRTVRLRRAWAYVSTKRGQNALPLLVELKGSGPADPVVLSYFGEAKRLVGDAEGAVAGLKEAVAAGAGDDLVVPTLRKIAYDAHSEEPKPAEGETPKDAPRWLAVGEAVLAVRDLPDVRLSLVRWAQAAGEADRGVRVGPLMRGKAIAIAWPTLTTPPADRASIGLSLSRLAFDLARLRATLPADAKGLPSRFDLLAQAVRLGETAGADGHEVPEALALLAQEALDKGRYVLADRMARRRLAISDSATARRVLLALPPDAGE
jgi:hypothetical protein